MTEPIHEPTPLIRFFSNPIVGPLLGIVGILLGIYFYAQSSRHRDLTYLVHPAKAVVVKTGQVSKLTVLVAGKEVLTDITATQIAFWNAGNEPIRREHMLRPFVIRTETGVPIIEATIRKTSREVVSLELDRSRAPEGRIAASWNILERDDGGIIQVIFARGPDTPISATAVIEGQSHIKAIQAIGFSGINGRYGIWDTVVLGLSWLYIGVGSIMGVEASIRLWRWHHQGVEIRGRVSSYLVYLGWCLAIVIMGVILSWPQGNRRHRSASRGARNAVEPAAEEGRRLALLAPRPLAVAFGFKNHLDARFAIRTLYIWMRCGLSGMMRRKRSISESMAFPSMKRAQSFTMRTPFNSSTPTIQGRKTASSYSG
jgi:hypothetical protein